MKAVVTGASGFVGNALCSELRRRGHSVVATVRSTPPKAAVDRVVVTGDIGPSTDWSDALRGADVVFHLAAHVHVLDRVAARDLAKFREVNVGGTESLARAAVAEGVGRVVFLSTVAIHGTDSGSGAFREDDPARPVTAYGTSKHEAELRLREICEATIVRAPLVYGPGVEAKFLQLLGILRRGLPLPFGAVRNRRSMLFIDNLCDALIVAAEHPAARNETFLIADDDAWSTPELIRELAAIMQRPPRLLPVPPFLLSVSDRFHPLITSLVIDTRKFRERTGWKPPRTAREGLRATVDWYTSLSRRAGEGGA